MADEGFDAKDHLPGFWRQKTMLYNGGRAGTSAGWSVADNGAFTLAKNLSAKTLIIPLSGLPVGSILSNMRIKGYGGGAAASAGVTAVCVLHRSANGATISDKTLATATMTNRAVAAALNGSAAVSEVKVEASYQYFVVITGTTGNNKLTSMGINGVEMDVRRS